jgi:hypothetical protein
MMRAFDVCLFVAAILATIILLVFIQSYVIAFLLGGFWMTFAVRLFRHVGWIGDDLTI